MSSLTEVKDSAGKGTRRWRIQFVMNGKRKTLRPPGEMPEKSAETIQSHADNLLAAIVSDSPLHPRTSDWLGKIGPALRKKLVKVGLAEPRASEQPVAEPSAESVRVYIDGFLARYAEKVNTGQRKMRTLWTARNDADCLFRYLKEKLEKPQLPLGEFTHDHADGYLTWMLAEDYAEATAARRVIRAREFFRAAVRSKRISENPFEGITVPDQKNDERHYDVSREEAQKLIDAAPDAEWRLIIALSRYGGLRTPSETLALRWGDVDFTAGRINVRSPKTERHKGKGSREIPLFPELREYLEDVHALARGDDGLDVVPDDQPVIRRYRDASSNLRTHLLRIMKRAGVEPWERAFHNMRASRQNELTDAFPEHVACAWIGNSKAVARQHYLSVGENHFAAALAREK